MTKPKPNTLPSGELCCALNEPWLGPHPKCREATARDCGVPLEDVILPDYSQYRQPLPSGGRNDD